MSSPIGIFDSGVGGLSILKQLHEAMPAADFLYLADNNNFPFGERENEEVVAIVGQGIQKLAERGCRTIVLACNTAATTSLEYYQQEFPQLTIDGVTPLLAEAVTQTKARVIAVYATHATLDSDYFKQQLAAVPDGIAVLTDASYDWVRSVEAGQFAPESVAQNVTRDVGRNADVIVLGCTHFAFLKKAVRDAAGPDAIILQPGPEIAARLRATLGDGDGTGTISYFVTTASPTFDALASTLMVGPVTTTVI